MAAVTTSPRKPPVRRLAETLLRHWQIISAICYAAGVITVLVLPVLSKPTYLSENALMPGSASTAFGRQSAVDARMMAEELQDLVSDSTDGYMAVRSWAIDRMAAIGADAYIHTFSCSEKPLASLRFFSSPQHVLHSWNATTCGSLGVNVVGIIRSPRSEGNEAVALVTPFTLEDGRLSAADKLTLSFGMALFEMYSFANWLARDVIWVMADARYGSHNAVAAWLEEYHEPKPHLLSTDDVAQLYGEIGDLSEGFKDTSLLDFKRAGFVSAGLVFDVSAGSRGQVDSVRVSAEGPNGQMPNLDLINVINTLAQWRRMHIQLDEIRGLRDSALIHGLGRVIENIGHFAGKVHRDWGFVMSAASYVESIATLCASVLNQAIGRSTGAHGAFRDYQIDAVTLNMFAGGDLESSSYQIDLFTRFGSLVEGVMRSTNNLLEKFHHSFFLYLLCSPSKFVSVGIYMIPLGLLLVTLPLGAAALNSTIVAADEVSNASQTRNLRSTEGSLLMDLPRGTLDIKTAKENTGRWRRAIIIVSAVQLWASLVALFPPAVSSLIDTLQSSLAFPTSESTSASLKMSMWTGLALLSLFVLVSSLPVSHPGDWMAVKALVLGLATIALVVLSQVDFAVSLIATLILVPICLCPSPWRSRQRTAGSIFGTLVTVLGSPPALLAAAILLGNAQEQVISLERLWQWTELLWSEGSALYIFLVVVYLPSSYLSLHVLFS